jgi:ubiquinone/menaquinone biosynthesis C-methylase UbiE
MSRSSPHPVRTFTHAQARAFYDRFGRRQDWQAFYEDRAVACMLRHAALASARSVVELGCGTGRLAARILRETLPADGRYLGVDVSSTMVALARQRLTPWRDRAEVRHSSGEPRIALPDGSCDRFVSAYVLDLLSDADIAATLGEAHRLLAPGGRLGLVSLTTGDDRLSRALCTAWSAVHRWSPALVGGCRPVVLRDRLSDEGWHTLHHEIVAAFGLRSEVLVAERRRS